MTWPQDWSITRSAPGRIRLGALLFLLVVVALGYLATKLGPPYWTYLNMVDPVKNAAMTMVTSRTSDERIRSELIRHAKENDLSLDSDNIDISHDGALLTVRVAWVAPVELPYYRYDLRFQIEERVPLR